MRHLLVLVCLAALIGGAWAARGEDASFVLASLDASPGASPAAASPVAGGSSGLGLTQTEWERLHGPGTTESFPSYEGGQYTVGYLDTRVYLLNWTPPEPIPTLAQAQALAPTLYPTDAQLTRSEVSAANNPVDRFVSAWLAEAFGPDYPLWRADSVGSFSVNYHVDPYGSGAVTSIVYQLGEPMFF